MRGLERNKRELYYALYLGETDITDDYGNLTGESEPTYGSIEELRLNISSSVGTDEVSPFGDFTNYTRVITVADINCPIDEDTIIWFGVSTDKPHNYIVTKKADSKNGIMYALLEVATNYGGTV